jgi:hypothetical protein
MHDEPSQTRATLSTESVDLRDMRLGATLPATRGRAITPFQFAKLTRMQRFFAARGDGVVACRQDACAFIRGLPQKKYSGR